MPCTDTLLELCPSLVKYNQIGDTLILLQGILAVMAAQTTPTPVMKRMLLAWVVLLLIREVVKRSTQCPDTNAGPPTPFGGPPGWHVMSGHMITSLLSTFIVLCSQLSAPWKLLSMSFSTVMFISRPLTQQHYTVDVLMTTLLLMALFPLLSGNGFTFHRIR